MVIPPHTDCERWQREHVQTYRLHRYIGISDDVTPPSFPRAGSVGRASTTNPSYWSSGQVRTQDAYWIFHYALSGEGQLLDERGTHLVPTNSGMLLRADDRKSLFRYPPGATARWEWLWFEFSGSAAMDMADDLVSTHGPLFCLESDEAVIRWLRDVTAPGRVRTIAPWVASEYVWHLLYALANADLRRDLASDGVLVGAARRVIAQRLIDQDLSVETIAQELGVSREHLSRTFREVVGSTPRQFIESHRLSMASQMLLRTGLSIHAVARQCGWKDADTFSAAFRRIHGQLPSIWRTKGIVP